MDAAGDSAGGDIDWEAERRPLDQPWVFLGALAAAGAVAAVLIAWLADAPRALGLGAAWVLWTGLTAAMSRFARRTYASQVGVPPARLPVLLRRIRQERIPRDPAARREMALLVRQQRRQLARRWWFWPLLTGMFLVTSAAQWLAGRDAAALMWVVLAALLIPGYLMSRRMLLHVRRVGVRLGQERDAWS
ncbi:hypothetical protein ACL02R_05720 [Streptomyces sp. MS19]|uniref:hypothetical protein n=1 Tax=Streptomyces sp. MS19 TaxID=3385972 RepID=UPI0039A1D26B